MHRNCCDFDILFDCSLFGIDGILSLVFGFLHNLQLEYWVTQSTTEQEIELFIRHVHALDPKTLLRLMQRHVSYGLIEKAEVKTTLPCVGNDNKWPCQQLRYLLKNGDASDDDLEHTNSTNVFNHVNNFDANRFRELHSVLDFTSWSKKDQAALFINVCYEYNDVSLVSWLWGMVDLIGFRLRFKFSRLGCDVLAFVLDHTTCDWSFDPVFVPSVSHVELLKTRWPDRMPTAVEALFVNDLDIAIAMWSTNNGECLSDFDSLIPDTQFTNHGMLVPSLFDTSKQQSHCPIYFEGQNANFAYNHQGQHRFNDRSIEPSFGLCEVQFEYLDNLVQSVLLHPEMESPLHRDTRAWLNNCLHEHCRDAYFWQACVQRVEYLVAFLWTHVDDATQKIWSQVLPLCLPFRKKATLLDMHPRIKLEITDHIDVLMTHAATHNNIAFWVFGLPLLTPREVYRACVLSMDCNSSFFNSAWHYIDRRYANVLFDLALAKRHRYVAMFLLEQPELQIEHLGDRLPVFIDMTLSDAIRRVPFYKHFTEAQILWCASHALNQHDPQTLHALHPLLPLAKAQWRQLVIKCDLTEINLDFVKALLQHEFVTGAELFALDKTRFLSVFDTVHFDI